MEELLPKDIVFINNEEVRAFAEGGDSYCEGFAYTWENEGVTHLHTQPLLHSFGEERRVAFVRQKDNIDYQHSGSLDSIEYIVVVANEGLRLKTSVYHKIGTTMTEVEFEEVPAKEDLHSRNKGLIELDILAQKHVAIIGLGSFGSQIAHELAKAGVGLFSVFDFDRVELHNLARHTSNVNDLGRLKTDAVFDLIKGKNPYAEVWKFPIDINKHIAEVEEALSKVDLVICATDNNSSRFRLSKIVEKFNKPCIFGGAITRAAGGHVFIYRPGQACYCCLIGNSWYDQTNVEMTDFKKARNRTAAYVSDDDVNAKIQVGLSADIEPISNMMVKLALLELSKGTNSGISMLEEQMSFNYYFWANRQENIYAGFAPFNAPGKKPTILRWNGVNIPKNPECAICSKSSVKLDEGEAIEDLMEELKESIK